MRIKEYQIDELARARALADEAAKLHIPVPVLSWRYEIKDASGNIEERGIGKANSYTRNALNAISYVAGLCSSAVLSNNYWGDGFVSGKTVNGQSGLNPSNFTRKNIGTNPEVILGIGTSSESVDDYTLTNSSLTAGTNNASSTFNSSTRKMITVLSRAFINNTASTINITESGVTMLMNIDYLMLFVRDVFTAIPVEPDKTITWTYVIEVSYPA